MYFTITEARLKVTAACAFLPQTKLELEASRARSCLGKLLPVDVGKRVYWRGGVYQVENIEQMQRRLDVARKNA